MSNLNSPSTLFGVDIPEDDNTTGKPPEQQEVKQDTQSIVNRQMDDKDYIDILGTTIDTSQAKDVKSFSDVVNVFKDVNPKTGFSNIIVPKDEVKQLYTNAFQNRVKEIANKRFKDDVEIDFSGVGTASETSTRLNELTDGEVQKAFGFIDNDKEAISYLNNKIGENNYRIFVDKDTSITEPNRWISVKRKDGTFTPFSPVTQTYTDIFKRVLPQIEYEARNFLYNEGTALGAANVVGKFPLPLPIKGTLMFATYAYSLYGGGKKTEAGREFIKQELGITKPEDIQEAENWLSKFGKAVVRAVPILTVPGSGTSNEEFAGLFELLGVGAASVAPWLKIAKDAVKNKFMQAVQKSQDAAYKLSGKPRSNVIIDVRTFVAKTQAEKSRAIKTGEVDANGNELYAELEDLIVPQAIFNRITDRFGALAEQTSTVIPDKLRGQMQSAVSFLRAYQKKEVGPGDIKAFRKNVKDLGKFLSGGFVEGDDAFLVSRTAMGKDLAALDDMYLLLRTQEANVLYGDIFSKLGTAKYNLDDVNSAISKEFKVFVPKTDPSLVPSGQAIVGDVPSGQKGEFLLKKLMYEINNIGTSRETGRVLTSDGINQAAKKFGELEENAGFVFDINNINTPAELLHLYAKRLGELGRDVYGKGGTAENGLLYKATKNIRNALLDTIAKPVNNPNRVDLSTISKDLKYANDFYKATFDTTSKEILTNVRISKNLQERQPESADAIYKLLGAPGKDVPGPITETVESIQKMEKYVASNIDKILKDFSDGKTFDQIKANIKEKDLIQLKEGVRRIISERLGRAAGFDKGIADSSTSAMAYIDSLGDAAPLLGITKEVKATLLEQANTIARIKDMQLFDYGIEPFGGDIQFKLVFDDIVQAGKKQDSAQALGSMIALLPKVGGKEATENLRKGIMEYVVSFESGVLKKQGKQSPYAAVDDTLIDNNRLTELVQQLTDIPDINKVLTEVDIEVLDTLAKYVGIIKSAGTDAGAALSGAQIISGLYTLDGKQLISSIGRLAAQKRMSKLLTDPKIVDILTGGGFDTPPMSLREKYMPLFISPRMALGKAASEFLFSIFGSDENQQTDFLLNNEMSEDEALKMFGAT